MTKKINYYKHLIESHHSRPTQVPRLNNNINHPQGSRTVMRWEMHGEELDLPQLWELLEEKVPKKIRRLEKKILPAYLKHQPKGQVRNSKESMATELVWEWELTEQPRSICSCGALTSGSAAEHLKVAQRWKRACWAEPQKRGRSNCRVDQRSYSKWKRCIWSWYPFKKDGVTSLLLLKFHASSYFGQF